MISTFLIGINNSKKSQLSPSFFSQINLTPVLRYLLNNSAELMTRIRFANPKLALTTIICYKFLTTRSIAI
jgi:hypothetical protein